MLIGYQVTDLSLYHHLQVLAPPPSAPANMSSPKQIVIGDYKAILLRHEDDYRQSKGGARRAVVSEITDEITAEGKGKFRKMTAKGLEQVSQFSH